MKKLNFLRRVMPLLALLLIGLSSVWGATYTKITTTAGLESGKNYLIVYESSSTAGKAMTTTATTTSTKRLTPADVTISGTSITTTATNIVWKLSGETNSWMFNNGTNYVNGSSSGGANCTGTASTGNKYTITAKDDGSFDLTITGNADRVLEYNTSGPYFAHYKSTQASVCLYKENAPTATYTVTFSAGDNGTCSTTSLTEASAGAGVTLPSCTANAGYKFLGWTATENKTTIDAGLTAGATYKPSANTTLYAVYGALYQVNIEEPTNGTLAVTCGGVDVTSGNYYAVGEVINIEATPATGYKFRNIQVVDGSTHTFTASNEKEWTMGSSDITIKANFDEIINRTITWSVNGNTTTIEASVVENGENITFPTTSTHATELADIQGKKFVGWSANSSANSASDLVSGNVAASADATYYAVYADVTPGEQETATLTCNTTTVNTTYASVDRTDDKNNTWTTYSTVNKQSINNIDHYFYGLNSNANGYRISSPEFSGNVQMIKVWIWNTSSKETRTAYLCSSTETAQPTSGDLGSLTVAPSTKNQEMTFSLESEEFNQFHIYVSAALSFEKIEVTYGTPDVYSNYTTTIATSEDITISAVGYATYFNAEYAYVMPDDCEGYVFTAANGLELAYEAEDVVPAGEPLVIYTIEPGKKTLVFTTSTEDTYKSGDKNDLVGAAADMTAEQMAAANEGMGKFYALSLNTAGEASSVGFYWIVDNGAAFAITAGKAYLALPAGSLAPAHFLFADEEGITTDVAETEAATKAGKLIEKGQLVIVKDGVRYNAVGQIVR